MPSLLPSDLYGGVYKSIVADPQAVRLQREQQARSAAERGELLRKQQQQEELQKVLGGVQQGDPQALSRFMQLDPEGAMKYQEAQQKNKDAQSQARTQGLMGLFGLPEEQRATAYPQYRQQLGGAESGLPEAYEPNSLMAMMHMGVKPETQADLRPKIPDSPKVGTFEDFVTRSFGANPTAAQLVQARKQWETADNVPAGSGAPTVGSFEDFVTKKYGRSPSADQIMTARKEWDSTNLRTPKLSEKMSNQMVDFSTGVNLLSGLITTFKEKIMEGPGGTGTAGAYVAGGVEKLPYIGGKLAPNARAYNDEARTVTEALLRAATGAAAPDQEVTRYTAFMPTPGMNPQEAQAKMDAYVAQIRGKAKGTTDALRLMGREEEAQQMEAGIDALLSQLPKISDGKTDKKALRTKYKY
jgi:hypothetical protein